MRSTAPTASSPLNRLSDLSSLLALELALIPDVDMDSIDATQPPAQRQQAILQLQREVGQFWNSTGLQPIPRRMALVTALRQSLPDILALSVEDGLLHPDYSRCLPGSTSTLDTYSLWLHLSEDSAIELHGALAFTADNGPTLLWLPGHGVEGYPSLTQMRAALVETLNAPLLRDDLLQNALQQHQDSIHDISRDTDLRLETFGPEHVQLLPIADDPFEHSIDRQLARQHEDIRYALDEGLQRLDNPQPTPARALQMPGLFGPAAILGRRESRQQQKQQLNALPGWFKNATPDACRDYLHSLEDYDWSRMALNSLLEGAASPEQFAALRLRAHLESDLGYDLNPQDLQLTTRRRLPMSADTYETGRSLIELALYGLHPGDLDAGSDFMNETRLSLDGAPPGAVYPLLTPAYLGSLIDRLDLRSQFGRFQRMTYGKSQVMVMKQKVLLRQLMVLAQRARLQGDIQDADLEIIRSLNTTTPPAGDLQLLIQTLKLNGEAVPGKLMVLRQASAGGDAQRLILFSPDRPVGPVLMGLHNETQLLQELVSWSASPTLCSYLLEQVKPAHRRALEEQLLQLRKKPQPAPDFMALVEQTGFNDTFYALAVEQVRVNMGEYSLHTPDWYLHASVARRQELIALEDAINGAQHNYQSKTHTQVQSFENYLHQRASEKINRLLGLPAATVDPDRIIITSPRETLSYTQMLRDGYDDTLGFLNPGADGQAAFSGPDGISLLPLTAEKVAASTRGAWVGDGYIEHIKNTLLNPDSDGYAYRQQTSLLIVQLQMRAAALRSLLKREISERQYSWLRTSIDAMHLDTPQHRREFPVYALQFRMSNPLIGSDLAGPGKVAIDVVNNAAPLPLIFQLETAQGCLILKAHEAAPAQQALLYTPQAPDGVEFRLFSEFVNTLKREGMSDYYKDRCRLKAGRSLAFFFMEMKKNGTDAPTLPHAPLTNLRETCFDAILQRRIRNVEDSTTSRGEMIARVVWTSIELIATALTLPFPVASFSVGLLLAMRDSVRALEALSEGDKDRAALYVLYATLNSLGAAGDLHSGLKGFGQSLRYIARGAESKGAIGALQQLAGNTPSTAQMHKVTLNGEPFWMGKVGKSEIAPLYRAHPHEPDRLLSTGHYGTYEHQKWQPLSLNNTQSAGLGKANPAYAVSQSLQGHPTIASGHAQGVTLIAGIHYVEVDGLVFQVRYDAANQLWKIVDPANPYGFFGQQPLRLDESGRWQVLDPLRLQGGAPPKFRPLSQHQTPASTPDVDLAAYELPKNLRNYASGIADPDQSMPLVDMGLMSKEEYEGIFQIGRDAYIARREVLYRDASAYFDSLALPLRVDVPPLTDSTSADALIKTVFDYGTAMVISEPPRSVAGKRLLIDNMARLAEQKVAIVYIEHLLTDQHLEKLHKYMTLGRRSRSGSQHIRQDLLFNNRGALNNGSTEYDYYHVIKAAHRHGIEVRPFNSTISYNWQYSKVAPIPDDPAAAQKMSIFLGNRIISSDVAASPGRRWVALLDQKIANRQQQLPGVSELQGAISVRVKDVASNQPTRITLDTGETVGSETFKGDYALEIANPELRPTAKAASSESPEPSLLDDNLYLFLEGKPAISFEIDKNLRLTEQRLISDNPYRGSHGFQLDTSGNWQRADAARWPAEQPLTPIQQSLMDPDYLIPQEMQTTLHELAVLRHQGLNENLFFPDAAHLQTRERFFTLRTRLQRDARRVISGDLPPRPMLPDFAPNTSLGGFIDELYTKTSGIVIGETHASMASKQFIIDNLPHLAKNQVRTLYLEHLQMDLHQLDLDRFAESGLMSKTLLHDLKRMDRGFHTDAKGVYTFEQLVIKAREHGIEVRAIDCAASYQLKKMPDKAPTTRAQMMNYFASRTIRRHQEVVGQHRWIALVGNSHASTYQKIVPGLAELEQGISVNLFDVGPGLGHGPRRDTGTLFPPSVRHGEVFIQADYRLALETAESVASSSMRPSAATPSVELRLSRPGMFLLDQSETTQTVIVHRSRAGEIHRTPIKTNRDGKLYVDRETWPQIHLKPFDDLTSLTGAMEFLNMRRVN